MHPTPDPAPAGAAPGAPRPRSTPPDASSREPLAGLPALRLVLPLAGLAVAATILGRMLAPAAAGLAVGTGRLVRGLEIVGGALTQLFAVSAVFVAMALLSAVARSRVPYGLRIGAILAGSFVMLIVLRATVERVPGLSSALIGVLAALLAIGAAWDARRAPFARPVALVLGLVGLGALARLAGVALAIRAADPTRVGLAVPARGIATAGFVIDALAVLVTIAVLAPRKPKEAGGGGSGDARPQHLASPLTLAALALALLATRQALAGGVEEASALDVLFRRALDRLLTRPSPLLPLGVQLFAAALGVLVALSALLARRDVPALTGALALALVARAAPDAPLGALSLVIAAFSLALAARDDRGLWAAILGSGASEAAAPAGAGRGSKASGADPQGPGEEGASPVRGDREVRQVDADDDVR